MARRTITFIIISCIVLALAAGESLSQTRRARTGSTSTRSTARWQATDPTQPAPPPPPDEAFMRAQEKQREFQQRMQQMRTQSRQNNMQMLRQTLQATDAQWQQIEPQLQRIERLKHEAAVSLDLSCFAPANFTGNAGSWQSSFGGGGSGGMGARGGAGGFGASTSPRGTGGGMMDGGTGGFGGRSRSNSTGGGQGAPGGMGGFGSGPGGPQQQSFSFTKTFQTGRPSSYKNPDELTDGDVLCEELLDMLQDPAAPAPEITRRVQALRATRQQAAKDLAVARGHLRANVNPKQEATLILMAYLD